MKQIAWPRGGILTVIIGFLVLSHDVAAAADYATAWTETGRLPAPEAMQAAAADDRFVYAVTDTHIAKYDRLTGALVSRSTGQAMHLNSATIIDGKLYCAHSNYPRMPEHSEIKIVDPREMVIETYKDFGASDGSLTWVVKNNGAWWCNFAFYGGENHKTYLVKYDDWRELARWTYPPAVVKAFGRHSASCGIWRDDKLLVTGHNDRKIFVLELPSHGEQLRLLATVPAPFTGQGFASDPVTGGLIGIDRAMRQIVFAGHVRN